MRNHSLASLTFIFIFFTFGACAYADLLSTSVTIDYPGGQLPSTALPCFASNTTTCSSTTAGDSIYGHDTATASETVLYGASGVPIGYTISSEDNLGRSPLLNGETDEVLVHGYIKLPASWDTVTVSWSASPCQFPYGCNQYGQLRGANGIALVTLGSNLSHFTGSYNLTPEQGNELIFGDEEIRGYGSTTFALSILDSLTPVPEPYYLSELGFALLAAGMVFQRLRSTRLLR